MARTNNKKRDRSTLKKKIVHATLALAEESGWATVSVRKIAAEVSYSTIIIYDLFGCKEGVMREVADEGFRLLVEQLFLGMQSSFSKRQQMLELSKRTWSFSLDNPALYAVMFGQATVPSNSPATEMNMHLKELSSEHFSELKILVQPYLNSIDETQSEALFYHWWALVQGFISLGVNNSGANREQLVGYFDKAIARFLDGRD